MEKIKNVHENTDHRPTNFFSRNSLIPPIGKEGNDGMSLFLKDYLIMLIICFGILVVFFIIIEFLKPKNKRFRQFKKL